MEQTISELINEVATEAQAIIRSELRLARAELNEQIAALKRISRTALPAFVLGLYAIGFLLLASVYALELVLPAWLSALIVAVGVGGVAGILLGTAYRQSKSLTAKPERTIESMRENVQWAKTQMR
jgi:hypothetical protein